MSEPSPVDLYSVELTPTIAELKLLARLRQIAGMCIVDSDSMTVWTCRGPEHMNGKRFAAERSLPFMLPIDT